MNDELELETYLSISPNNGKKTFLLKWKLSVEFFTKHFLSQYIN